MKSSTLPLLPWSAMLGCRAARMAKSSMPVVPASYFWHGHIGGFFYVDA